MKNRNKKLISATLVSINGLLIYLHNEQLRKKHSKRHRICWMRDWLRKREEGRGSLNLLNMELLVEHPAAYRNFLRVNDAQFNVILNLIQEDIRKEDTFMREAISAKHRLDITLRFLATGESFRSLMYSMRVHESTVSKIIFSVCRAIYKFLKSTYLKTPRTSLEWEQIAADFESKWNFPHCIGALDGRHITFTPPISSGSYYYNYKGTNSIVLLGLVDANYRFIYVNVGVNGRVSDGGVFDACGLSTALQNNTLQLPNSATLPGRSVDIPYVIIADDAFPLTDNIMKPFPQRNLNFENRIFNYRLSRARRMVESAFGILANRFRVLLNPIHLGANKVQDITLACIVLHNYLAVENSSCTAPTEFDDFSSLPQIVRQSGNMSANSARLIREEFKNYFNSNGAVPWQNDAVNRGNY